MSSQKDRRAGGVLEAVERVRRPWLVRVSVFLFACLLAPVVHAQQEVECATMRWTPASGPVIGYDVYVEINGGAMLYHTSTTHPQLRVVGEDFASGDVLRFQVVGFSADGQRGDPSPISAVVFCDAVPTPTGLFAEEGSLLHPIALSWDPVDQVEFYVVFRSLDPDSPGTYLGQADEPFFDDVEAEAEVDYYYSVAAVSGQQVSAFTPPVMGRAGGALPRVVASTTSVAYEAAPGEQVGTQTVTLRNIGDWEVAYQAWAGSRWLTLDPSAGEIDDGQVTLTLRYDLSRLQEGVHRSLVQIYSYYTPPEGQSFQLSEPEEVAIEVTVPGGNAAPVFETALDVTVVAGTTTVVPIRASDPDPGDVVQVGVAGALPEWVSFESTGDGEGLITLAPPAGTVGVYGGVAAAWDDHEPAAVTLEYFTVSVEGGAGAGVSEPVNQAPIVDAVADRTVAVGELVNLYITANDPEGDAIAMTPSSIPSFARFLDLGGGTGKLALDPEPGDEGSYVIIIGVVDDGDPPAFSSVWFVVDVE